jgi:hypothetical protein
LRLVKLHQQGVDGQAHALAHRSFTEERSGTLAARDQNEWIERAIKERRRVRLRHLPDVATDAQKKQGQDASV